MKPALTIFFLSTLALATPSLSPGKHFATIACGSSAVFEGVPFSIKLFQNSDFAELEATGTFQRLETYTVFIPEKVTVTTAEGTLKTKIEFKTETRTRVVEKVPPTQSIQFESLTSELNGSFVFKAVKDAWGQTSELAFLHDYGTNSVSGFSDKGPFTCNWVTVP